MQTKMVVTNITRHGSEGGKAIHLAPVSQADDEPLVQGLVLLANTKAARAKLPKLDVDDTVPVSVG